ncbi:unnamed protein product, partial [Anisakis simplex]|uniref:Protein ORF122 n=1 Tax=Anisakis simplex TaxID=6269 RepID=A0A0M3KCC7_ANISI
MFSGCGDGKCDVMQMYEGNSPSGALTLIVIAAVAIGIGFLTIICTLISVTRSRRSTRRLQTISPERVVSPGACASLNQRLPSLRGDSYRYIASSVHETNLPPQQQTPKSFVPIDDAPPPTYEDAIQMAIQESLRHCEHETAQQPHSTVQQ